jgi:hypothetical protein
MCLRRSHPTCFGLYQPSSGVDICLETAALFLLFNICCWLFAAHYVVILCVTFVACYAAVTIIVFLNVQQHFRAYCRCTEMCEVGVGRGGVQKCMHYFRSVAISEGLRIPGLSAV